jgi:REP element-mobilizing transposase RayT
VKFDPQIHHPYRAQRGRRSIRLKEYDYSQSSGYFITIVTQGRECLFGEVVEEEMKLNTAGETIKRQWEELPQRFPRACLDVFIVMPNHFHGIIVLTESVGATLVVAHEVAQETAQKEEMENLNPEEAIQIRAGTSPAPTIGDIVGAFKSITTNAYIRGVNNLGWTPFMGKLWQRNYYEHIIRSPDDYDRIRNYIELNPSQWAADDENPLAPSAPSGYS